MGQLTKQMKVYQNLLTELVIQGKSSRTAAGKAAGTAGGTGSHTCLASTTSGSSPHLGTSLHAAQGTGDCGTAGGSFGASRIPMDNHFVAIMSALQAYPVGPSALPAPLRSGIFRRFFSSLVIIIFFLERKRYVITIFFFFRPRAEESSVFVPQSPPAPHSSNPYLTRGAARLRVSVLMGSLPDM